MGEFQEVQVRNSHGDPVNLKFDEDTSVREIRAKVMEVTGYDPQETRKLQVSFSTVDWEKVTKHRDTVDKKCNRGGHGLIWPKFEMCELLDETVTDSAWLRLWSRQLVHAHGVVIFRSSSYMEKVARGKESPLYREAQAILMRLVIDSSFQAFALEPEVLHNGPADLRKLLQDGQRFMNIEGWTKDLKKVGCEIAKETVSSTLAEHVREGKVRTKAEFSHIARHLEDHQHINPEDAFLLFAKSTELINEEKQLATEQARKRQENARQALEEGQRKAEEAQKASDDHTRIAMEARRQTDEIAKTRAEAVQAAEVAKTQAAEAGADVTLAQQVLVAAKEAKTKADAAKAALPDEDLKDKNEAIAKLKAETEILEEAFKVAEKTSENDIQEANKACGTTLEEDLVRNLCMKTMKPHFSLLNFADFHLVEDIDFVAQLLDSDDLNASEDQVFDAANAFVAEVTTLTQEQILQIWSTVRFAFISAAKLKLIRRHDHNQIPWYWFTVGCSCRAATEQELEDLLEEVNAESPGLVKRLSCRSSQANRKDEDDAQTGKVDNDVVAEAAASAGEQEATEQAEVAKQVVEEEEEEHEPAFDIFG